MPSAPAKSEHLRDHLLEMSAMLRGFRSPPDGWEYVSTHEFIGKKGILFPHDALSRQEETAVRKVLKDYLRYWDPKTQQCYGNASRLAEMGIAEGFEYAEGYAAGIIPVNHAWVAYHGKVLDVTWRELEDKRPNDLSTTLLRIRENAASHAYMGVLVPISYLHRMQVKKRYHDSVIDNWKDGFPMLRKDFSFERRPRERTR